MSSLADLPEVIGFFSYSREDDESYKGRLSALRDGIQHELSAQLGRSKTTFRLWQDKENIAPGKMWESEITNAVEQSVFFIPIITPRALNSRYCEFEFNAFLGRERALGRTDLVFPILYVPVQALESEAQWRDHPVLSIIGKRQYVDWQTFRYADVHTPAMREEIARFARKIVEALHASWLSPEERQQETEAKRRAEKEARRKQDEAESELSREERLRRLLEERGRMQAARAHREDDLTYPDLSGFVPPADPTSDPWGEDDLPLRPPPGYQRSYADEERRTRLVALIAASKVPNDAENGSKHLKRQVIGSLLAVVAFIAFWVLTAILLVRSFEHVP